MSFHFNSGSVVEETLCSCATLACDPEPLQTESTVDMATQSWLKSLSCDPRGQDTVQQTKSGLPCYDGNPYNIEQWYFVVLRKYDDYASNPDKYIMKQHHIELSVKVIEGLKNDALKCAMDFARDVAVAPDGDLKIVDAIKASWAGDVGDRNEGVPPREWKAGRRLGTRDGGKRGTLRVASPLTVQMLDHSRQDVRHHRTPSTGDDELRQFHRPHVSRRREAEST